MKQGYDKIPIRTVDTDVVVLAAQRLNITELWVAFGCSEELPIFTSPRVGQRTGCEPLCYFCQCFMPSVDDWLSPPERLLVLLYDCTSSQEFVNGVRKQFTQKGRAIVLRHKLYLSSTQNRLLTKPVTVGHRQ